MNSGRLLQNEDAPKIIKEYSESEISYFKPQHIHSSPFCLNNNLNENRRELHKSDRQLDHREFYCMYGKSVSDNTGTNYKIHTSNVNNILYNNTQGK